MSDERKPQAETPPRAVLAVLVSLVTFACGFRVGPDYEPPDLAAREDLAWRAPAGPEITEMRADLALWWRRLESAELDELAQRLVRENLSLGEARQRVAAARIVSGIVGSRQEPQADLAAAYVRAGTGNESLNYIGPPPGLRVDVYSAGIEAAWELDLWGRVARMIEAAEADVDVAVEDYRDATVALLAQLSLAYVDAVTLRGRLDVLRRGVAVEEESARLARSRLDAGNGSRLAVDQAELALALARARIPDVERALRAAENRIAVLIGLPPADGLVAAADELALPPIPGRGLPADLLARRADVRAAERRLAGAVARIGAAEGERYPTLAIRGTLFLSAMELGTLGGTDALSYTVGPGLVVPLFDGGRLAGQVRLSEAGAEAARIAFERTLLDAVREVDDAAEASARARESLARLDAAAASARTAVGLAEELQRSGVQGLAEVLAARRAELSVESEMLLARQAAFAATVDLYRALGGGWEPIGLDGTLDAPGPMTPAASAAPEEPR